MEIRPKCRRCKRPMDFSHLHGFDADEIGWDCFVRPTTDAEFWQRWNNLDGDDVVRLEKQLEETGYV